MAFVDVDAPRHDRKRRVAHLPHQERSGMARHGRTRKAGNIRVGHLSGAGELVRETPEPAAKHECSFWKGGS